MTWPVHIPEAGNNGRSPLTCRSRLWRSLGSSALFRELACWNAMVMNALKPLDLLLVSYSGEVVSKSESLLVWPDPLAEEIACDSHRRLAAHLVTVVACGATSPTSPDCATNKLRDGLHGISVQYRTHG